MFNRREREHDLINIRPQAGSFEISRGRTVFVSRFDGTVDPDCSRHGLHVYDTRLLSRYTWLMNGKQPEFSCGSNLDQSSWMGFYLQAPQNYKDTPTGESDPLQQTIELRLTRSVGEGLHEDVLVKNHTQIETVVNLELKYRYQFVSREEVSCSRKQRGKLSLDWCRPRFGVWEQNAEYRARHWYNKQGNKGVAHFWRGLKLRIENASTEPNCRRERISFEIHLAPRGEWRACLSWLASFDGQELPFSPSCSRVSSSNWNLRRAEYEASATSFPFLEDHDLSSTVNRVLRRSRTDLSDLRMYDLDSDGGIVVAAGVPTYLAAFGRDMEAVSWQAPLLSLDFLRGSLNFLNNLGAVETNDWRDAQPGRLPHEMHTDPLSMLNYRPKSLYFGSVTSSYLFPIMVSELWRWSGKLDSVERYVSTALRALKWADTYSLDETGFYRYQTHSEQGEENQAWKDSSDAIVYPDGSQVRAPIGTCEMQAFMYAAKSGLSQVLWRMGEKDTAWQIFCEAESLKARFNEKFWMEDEGYFGLAIDNEGELVRSVASDAGHALLCGIAEDSRVRRVADRMLREDLFSGWGIRTLSALHPAYNPFSYHRGSVWPVVNADFVSGFGRYGLHEEMHILAKAMFEAADLFAYDRLPELFGGHERSTETPFPGLYTRADWPQAWSASAAIKIVQALLGVHPYAPAGILFLDPHLPEWLPEITLEGMRVANSIVSIRFERRGDGTTEHQVLATSGDIRIVPRQKPSLLTAGWAERVNESISTS
jgi:glycogen debranching enzyme